MLLLIRLKLQRRFACGLWCLCLLAVLSSKSKFEPNWTMIRVVVTVFAMLLIQHWLGKPLGRAAIPSRRVVRLSPCWIRPSCRSLLRSRVHPVCLFFLVADLTNFPDGSWVVDNNLQTATVFDQYTFGLFAMLSCMLGCGYGTYAAGGPQARRDPRCWCIAPSFGAISPRLGSP